MNNYMNSVNDDLFKFLSVPEGISKDTVVSNIILKGGEFEVLYSNPLFMQSAIKTWSEKWNWTFSRWIKAINEEYNPLHNYDRTEEYTDITSGNVKTTSNATTESNSTDSSTNSSTNEDTKSAFDSNSYEPLNKSVGSGSTNGYSMSDISSDTESENIENRTLTHSAKMYGNIGVTSSQDMLKAELELAYWNLYDKIADVFLQEFIIPVY